jgi:hypothetical protein
LALVTGIAQRIKIRLFVEGVEVPCISASVQAAPNSPVMCSMQILPLAEATRFAPRSLVHLFFVDEFDTTVPNLRTTNTDKSPGPTVYEQVRERQGREPNLEFAESDLNDFRLQKYKLMFVGEIMGFSWTKTPRNRAVVLQCADLSNYWDYAYQHNNTDLFGPGYKAMFSGGSTNLFTDFLSSPGEIMSKILQTPQRQVPGAQGVAGRHRPHARGHGWLVLLRQEVRGAEHLLLDRGAPSPPDPDDHGIREGPDELEADGRWMGPVVREVLGESRGPGQLPHMRQQAAELHLP